MKKVYVCFHTLKGQKRKKWKLPINTKSSLIRELVMRDLPEYQITNFILLQQKEEGLPIFLDESKSLKDVNSKKKLRLNLHHRFRVTKIQFVDGTTKKVKLDLQETVAENISHIVSHHSSEYVFCYLSQIDPSFHRITCNTLPLLFQDWHNEKLILVRRITLADISNLKNKKKNRLLYEHCKAASSLGISLFSFTSWGQLGYYQFIINGGKPENFKRSSITPFIPEALKNNETASIAAFELLKHHPIPDVDSAISSYIQIAATAGAECCYIDRIKFLLNEKKWKMQGHRLLYVSPTILCVTKVHGGMFIHHTLISHIQNVKIDDDFVIFSFQNGEKWRIKSERPYLLLTIVEEMRVMAQRVDDAVSKTISIKGSQISVTEDIITNNISTVFWGIPQDEVVIYDQPIMEPGLSPIILPNESESNEAFSIDDQLFRNLKLIKEIEPIKPLSDENDVVPDISHLFIQEKLFSFNQAIPRIIVICFLFLFLHSIFSHN